MKSLNGVAVAALIAAVAAPAAFAQDAVQWRVEDGGNGHWYRFTRFDVPVCWHAARQLSEAAGGHLATLTADSENQYVIALVDANDPGVLEGGPFVGATCVDVPWGQWAWVTGEPFEFTAWNWGEPNSGGSERYVHLWRWGALGWNDTSECSSNSLVTEWSTDCNGDGIVDYGQILDGTFADVNENGVPDCCEDGTDCQCLGDVNNDGQVNGADISVLLGFWGLNGKPVAADINKDGSVDGADLAQLLGSWGPCK